MTDQRHADPDALNGRLVSRDAAAFRFSRTFGEGNCRKRQHGNDFNQGARKTRQIARDQATSSGQKSCDHRSRRSPKVRENLFEAPDDTLRAIAFFARVA